MEANYMVVFSQYIFDHPVKGPLVELESIKQ